MSKGAHIFGFFLVKDLLVGILDGLELPIDNIST